MSPASYSQAPTLERIRGVIAAERDALSRLHGRVDQSAADAVAAILACRGRLIVSGAGKAGLIAQKLAASFRSTGTPAVFLHAADALHGDLGIVSDGDVVVLLSKSGETAELVALGAAIRRKAARIVGLLGSPGSTLGRLADVVIDVGVGAEADPLNVAPTASTTAMLAMGDALVVAVAEERGLSREQFLALHPAGALGARLRLAIVDVMRPLPECPLVAPDVALRVALVEMSGKRLGAIFVTDGTRLLGIFTDGDLRRLLETDADPWLRPVAEVMTPNPVALPEKCVVVRALETIEAKGITVAPVVDAGGLVVGAVHLHDLVKAGLS